MFSKRTLTALITTVVLSIQPITSVLDLKCNNNQVHYWGQNSYGASHLNNPELWEKDLAAYCDDDTVEVINLSFLNIFNAGAGLPEINFANHCETFFTDPEASKLRNCPKIGQDIKYCQAKGKTLILSLGGAIARTELPSEAAAVGFADTLWNMFMAGTHKYRPFGDAVVNGVDLDLEGGSQANYGAFLARLQQNFNSDPQKRKYYVTAAPQCEFPDRNLQTIMESGHLDFINIQFYNNWCGVQNYDNIWAWNYPAWDTWVKTKSYNKNAKLYLGVPAAQTAAGTGYITIPALQRIINDLRTNYTSFGGVMMWDASQSENNVAGGKTYGKSIKEYLNANKQCSGTTLPPTSSSIPPPVTSTTVSSKSSLSTTTITSTSVPSSSSKPTSSSVPSSTTPSSTSKPPSPTGCPVNGGQCSSGQTCNGADFIVCDQGKWLVRTCPGGTVCAKVNGQVTCDWPGNNPVTPCT